MPVSAYSLFPYGGAKSFVPSATLLIADVVVGHELRPRRRLEGERGFPFIQIVAQQDDTEVRIRPKVDILDGVGVPGGIRGAVARLEAESRAGARARADGDSLAGSPIETSHPSRSSAAISARTSTTCPRATRSTSRSRPSSSGLRATPLCRTSRGARVSPARLARRSGCSGAWSAPPTEPSSRTIPVPPPGAPTSLASGQVTTFTSEQPFRVKSQDPNHPFFLAVHMSGADIYGTLGDPDFVVTVPDDQFLDSYVFFLDHTYADSNLTVVRRKDANGFHEVTIDCLGPVTGWLPLGTDGTTEYAWVDMTLNRAPVGSCGYGRHEAKSGGAIRALCVGRRLVRELRLPRRRGEPADVAVFASRFADASAREPRISESTRDVGSGSLIETSHRGGEDEEERLQRGSSRVYWR